MFVKINPYFLFFVLFLSFGDRSGIFAAPIKHFGVLLPLGSKPKGGDPHRFVSARSYQDTVREFHHRFVNSPDLKRIGEEISLPHVRSISYRNTDPRAGFLAINISLNVRDNITEIFFVTCKAADRCSMSKE